MRLAGLLVAGFLRDGDLDLGEGILSRLCGVLLLCLGGLSCLGLCGFFLGDLLLCL